MIPKKFLIIGLVCLLAGIIAAFWFFGIACQDDWCFIFEWQRVRATNSFEECVVRGFPVMESYPRQCRAGDKTFTESSPPVENGTLEQFVSEKVRLSSPRINEIIGSPLSLTGEARGLWFFEASFPVRILDGGGDEIAVGYVQATSDWMTESFVPFEGRIEFQMPKTESGTLVLEKDNPSGLPEHYEEVRIPIRFKASGAPQESTEGCKITGCSGQICSGQDMITTCEMRPEYACYRTARCEEQQDGNCGWTMTDELRNCLEDASAYGPGEGLLPQ